MNTMYTLVAFLCLFFFITGGAIMVVLTEKWNWLDRQERKHSALVFYNLFFPCCCMLY